MGERIFGRGRRLLVPTSSLSRCSSVWKSAATLASCTALYLAMMKKPATESTTRIRTAMTTEVVVLSSSSDSAVAQLSPRYLVAAQSHVKA